MASAAQIRVDPAESTPVYRQIVDQLRVLIVEGVLEVGQALPPLRQLAVELGVHFNTVAEAYRLLAQEGLVEMAHGRTTRVAAVSKTAATQKQQDAAMDAFCRKLRQLVAEGCARGADRTEIARTLKAFSEDMET